MASPLEWTELRPILTFEAAKTGSITDNLLIGLLGERF